MGPLLQLPELLEDVLHIAVSAIDHETIVGSCAIVGDQHFIYLPRQDEVNALYMCARQLGHLLLLRERVNGKVVVASIELSHETNHTPLGSYKRFADHFALELLVPTRGLGIALKEVRALLGVKNPALGDIELLYLARIFGTNFLVLARRCERAKLLPKGGANALYAVLVDKYGGPEKRAETLGLPPRPKLSLPVLPRAALLRIRKLANERPEFVNEAALQLGMSQSRLRELVQAA
jgi:Zn-dependent peptidase ImmA (M78 family)